MKKLILLLIFMPAFFANCFASAKGITFKKTKLLIEAPAQSSKAGQTNIVAEIADTPELRSQGLMNRTSLKDKEGMIFIFPKAEIQGFWMKNTLIPLSIGFFDEKGYLFQTLDMEPASPIEVTPTIFRSAKPAKYGLEVPKGWFVRQKITLGSKLQIPELKIP